MTRQAVRWLTLLTVCGAVSLVAGWQTFYSPPWTPGHPIARQSR